MSGTDKLRALLDARGVGHADIGGMTEFTGANGRICRCYARPEPLTVDVAILAVPAERAVDAALGRGECEMRRAEGSFRSASRPVYLCECGAFCTDYTDASAYHEPRYCPNCGRRAKEGR